MQDFSKYWRVGAGGFIGGHLVKKLLDNGNSIVSTDIKPKEYWFQDFETAENYYSMDMKDINNCRKVTKNIRLFETVLGDGIQGTADNEVRAKEGGRKSIVANTYIKKGSTITKEMLTYKRPGDGISPDRVNELIGKVVQLDIEEDFQIKWGEIK